MNFYKKIKILSYFDSDMVDVEQIRKTFQKTDFIFLGSSNRNVDFNLHLHDTEDDLFMNQLIDEKEIILEKIIKFLINKI